MEIITSSSNKIIKFVTQLFNDKKYRDINNMFCVESKRICKQLIQNDYTCKYILISKESKYKHDFKDKLCYFTTDSIIKGISDLATSDGVIGVFVKQKNEFTIEQSKKYVILDKIQNPSNLGAIARTCAAFNIEGIVISNYSVDIYHQQVIRGSMGAIFNLKIKFSTNLKQTIQDFKDRKYTVYATALNKTSKSFNMVIFKPNSVVIFGNEGNGINESDLKICDEVLHIDISKNVESLNLAAAAAIIVWKLSQ